MLRFTLLVLLIANAGYFAWGQGWMATLGWAPQVQSEAFRLQQQVRPEVLQVSQHVPPPADAPLPSPPPVWTPPAMAPVPSETSSAEGLSGTSSAPPALTVDGSVRTDTPALPAGLLPAASVAAVAPGAQCLQTGSFDEAQTQQLRQRLRNLALPVSSWELVPTAISGRWMVYMGKFANEMALEKRRGELRARKVSFDRVSAPFELGLSLGRFSTEEAAQRELGYLADKGIKGARVVQEREAHTVYTLRLPQATEPQQRQLQAALEPLGDKPWRACSS